MHLKSLHFHHRVSYLHRVMREASLRFRCESCCHQTENKRDFLTTGWWRLIVWTRPSCTWVFKHIHIYLMCFHFWKEKGCFALQLHVWLSILQEQGHINRKPQLLWWPATRKLSRWNTYCRCCNKVRNPFIQGALNTENIYRWSVLIMFFHLWLPSATNFHKVSKLKYSFASRVTCTEGVT